MFMMPQVRSTTPSTAVLAACLLAAFVSASGAAEATEGHPLVPAYPGSSIDQPAEVSAFDELDLSTGPNVDGGVTKSVHVEGKVTTFAYRHPEGRSVLEIFRNYEGGLAQAGFEILFKCNGEQCGPQVGREGLGYVPNGDDAWYLAARLARPAGDVFLAVHVQPLSANFVVVEVKPMEAGLVTISADALGADLARSGHAAVYELLFDTGKSDLKPASAGVLKEIAKLLSSRPSLRLHVVGHTDNVGTLAQNLDLSRRRAEAVVAGLTTAHAVAGSRLEAHGVGSLAPVAGNGDDAGRARNRRVELVEQ